ncbi:hypothetical protein [Streptomyces sp. NRRL S-1022]|uniref:hypothetical protein n=1 Tax=Streptomyces sp. NRRL S-1022 TaxID=1463880 RepID=UPI000A40004C|nr:hypothetical protein [Streptomyces sp. NRRL S-1022]
MSLVLPRLADWAVVNLITVTLTVYTAEPGSSSEQGLRLLASSAAPRETLTHSGRTQGA